VTESLRELLERLDVDDPERCTRRLETYVELIQRYGRRINLVGNLDEVFIREQLIGGSLQLLRVGRPSGRLIDVGSGAGLPGLPLALALPQLHVTLVEIRQKRSSFLRRAVQLLQLNRVDVVEADVADIADTFDWAASRAFKPPSDWIPIGLSLVRPGGCVACYSTQRAWNQLQMPAEGALRGLADDPTGEDRIVACVERVTEPIASIGG